jgi:hypothetical protein
MTSATPDISGIVGVEFYNEYLCLGDVIVIDITRFDIQF